MKRYTKLYWLYAKNHFKVMMEYRMDFLIGVLSVFGQQFAALFFLSIVFQHIESLNGWGFYEILFIYGIAFLGRAVHHIFFDNLWTIGWQYIRTGNLDRILMRPESAVPNRRRTGSTRRVRSTLDWGERTMARLE
ncbi:ABC-2 family transporter protein [Exiguobacterium sp. s48]|uniref:ABC-2 family transporter protein n=1 Tax=Exiguobacterium sp. s48 TaxID=2751273 RepID=UPI0020369503|nr:ABC-2 family transporter protein [Exiguobacterium sp. s48]